jgi:molecular chaperone GrpE
LRVKQAVETEEIQTTDKVQAEPPEIQQGDEQAEAEEEAPSLKAQLAEAQAQAAEYLDGWQRARAELANYKRRTKAQHAEMVLSANSDLLIRLLPVLDDLQLALDNSSPEDIGAWEEWREGVSLVAHKFAAALEGVGVVAIEAEGQFFDPNVHEAISHEANPDFESGQIIAQVRQGYKLGDRVLRAAMVRVAQ